MGILQRLFCSDSYNKIKILENENAIRYDRIKELQKENALLKSKSATNATNDFSFDSAYVKSMSSAQLFNILTATFHDINISNIRLADNVYKYTTLAEVQRWASFDPTNELKYRADELDCDKYALTDMADFKKENKYQLGNAIFGICWGRAPIGSHAWNIAYTDEGIIMLEPQTDEIWKWDDKKDYKPEFIYI